jgi:hypothetical protein
VESSRESKAISPANLELWRKNPFAGTLFPHKSRRIGRGKSLQTPFGILRLSFTDRNIPMRRVFYLHRLLAYRSLIFREGSD